MSLKIDVHHHVYPPKFTQVLQAAGGDPSGWYVPEWTREKDKALSSQIGNGTAILSVTAPGPVIEKDPTKAAALARELNEYCAKLRDDDPSGYGFFACLPDPADTKRCIEEIAYALDTLKADGVILLTRYGQENGYLGHQVYRDVWAELNRRRAVVFIHPTHPVDTHLVNEHSPQPMYDYPYETTRTAMDLIMNNNMREFPDCKIILSHAGGSLPYLIYRVAVMLPYTPMTVGKSRDEILEDARRFYFDLALSVSPPQMKALLEFARPDHVPWGSDFPNAPSTGIVDFSKALDEYDLPGETRRSIFNGAALELFPRLQHLYA